MRPLGTGRTGQVFLARDTLLDRLVAVKFVQAKDGEALSRFLNEARAAARVQHPNVVTLYRVGQLEDRAFLISEYTRGVSLDRLKKPVPWDRALTLARELARGLAAAHRRGVLHRDVKPGNAILTEGGQVKLLDFGLAKLADDSPSGAPTPGAPPLTMAAPPDLPPGASLGPISIEPVGALVGTPFYMAPEAWRGEPHTLRSDLYSLGALLFEFCAGAPPFRGVSLDELPGAVNGRPAPKLAERAPGVDSRFAAIVDRCLERDPLARFESSDALLDALEAISSARSEVRVPEGNPYRGLRAFEADHRALFFGRRDDLRDALDRLASDSLLVLAGDSGVGKSSLAAAAIIPAVLDGRLEDGRRWSQVRMVPGTRPLSALSHAAAAFLKVAPETLEREIRDDPRGLARRLVAALGRDAGLVLYLDQLEELVTLSPPAEAELTAVALAPLCSGVANVRVLASARSDFLTRLGALGAFGHALSRSLFLVRPLGPAQVREAIVGPAQLKGARYESEALVNQLVQSTVDAGGGLPLLQFALAQLWDARDVVHGVISAASLTALGGVAGALARHADGVLEALHPEERAAARRVLLRLVSDSNTRARRSAAELTDGDSRYHAALEALVRGRLVVGRDGEEGGTYEIAHEALLSGWRTLSSWLVEEAETRELRQRLELAARDWDRVGRRRELLWGERALVSAGPLLAAGALSDRELAFLGAARRQLRRSRWIRIGSVVAVLALVLLAFLVSRLREALEREAAADAALANAHQLLSTARETAMSEVEARAAAFAKFDAREKVDAEEQWDLATRLAAEADRAFALAGDAFERALAIDPERDDVRDGFSELLYQRAVRAERDRRPDLVALFAHRLELLDEGGPHWARWQAPATLGVLAPAGAELKLERYVRGAGSFELEPVTAAPSSKSDAVAEWSLPAGSYRVSRLGDPPVVATVLLERGARTELDLRPPSSVPEGFVYVPAGQFLFGSAANESIRQFFNAVPLHPVATGPFLIARHETTWAEYLRFLEALPGAKREEYLPRGGSTGLYGGLRVRQRADGRWELSMRPAGELFTAIEGEPLRYPGRKVRAEVDWLRLPVVGITQDDARAYARWLDQTGRVPGARLCDEREWERAARGADDREYPHGNRLSPDEANFDATYGKDPLAFGPDPVGSHPASRSPFGVDDLAGNVWEWTENAVDEGGGVARGGSYYFAASTARLTNREVPHPSFRDLTVGMRICVDGAMVGG